MATITLGTRGSALALAQADLTTAALASLHPQLQIRREIIQTTGDIRQDLRLGSPASGADKAVWTKELEQALLEKRVDIAVHSLKDVPAILPEGFLIAGVLPRADTRDVLLSKHPNGLAGLPQGAVIATSSVRRLRQLQWLRPDLKIEPIRGNVPTRIEKVSQSQEFDALLLAKAGLDRLGLTPTGNLEWSILSHEIFAPAASQGAVAFEIRADDPKAETLVRSINHTPTWLTISAEREFLRLLGAGCHTPVGLHTHIDEEGQMSLSALVFDETDTKAAPRQARFKGPAGQPEFLAAQLHQLLK